MGKPVHGSLRAAFDTNLPQQTRYVVLDGFLGKSEVITDLAVRQPLGDQPEDLAFTQGQRHSVGCRLIEQAHARSAHEAGIHQLCSSGDLPDGGYEASPSDIFQQPPLGPREDCGLLGIVIVEGGEHDARNVRVGRPDIAACVNSRPVRQTHVEYRHIRGRCINSGDGVAHGTGFAHHREIGFPFDDIDDTSADQFVVVEEKDTDHRKDSFEHAR
jgi:hypothetical protein